MKKTLITLLAMAGVAFGDSPLTLVDQWTFDGNWNSVNGRQFTGSSTQVDYTSTAGIAKVKLYNSASGWYLNDTNALGLTSNWALQITVGLEDGAAVGSTNFRDMGGLFNTNNGSGTSLNMTGGAWKASTTDGSDMTTLTVDTTGSLITYTLLNYNNKLYLAADGDWADFILSNGATRDYVDYGAATLNQLTLGYRGDNNSSLSKGNNNNVYMLLDDIKVYSFDSNAVTLQTVKDTLVPEPATATLSLLALAGLAARRRRK